MAARLGSLGSTLLKHRGPWEQEQRRYNKQPNYGRLMPASCGDCEAEQSFAGAAEVVDGLIGFYASEQSFDQSSSIKDWTRIEFRACTYTDTFSLSRFFITTISCPALVSSTPTT